MQQKLLLLLRSVFLVALVLAFAQPLFYKSSANTKRTNLYALFIDNSYSMSVKTGGADLLQQVQQSAINYISSLPNNARIWLVTQDPIKQYHPINKETAISQVSDITFTSNAKSFQQIATQLEAQIQSLGEGSAQLIYFSDLQKKDLSLSQIKNAKPLNVEMIQVVAEETRHVFIDTAWINEPIGSSENSLIVRSKSTLPLSKEDYLIQLTLSGQLKSATTPKFNNDGISVDTIKFSVTENGWQPLMLHLQDPNLRFDDTFRIATQMGSALKVLYLFSSRPSPFILAALHADPSINVSQKEVGSINNVESTYNLIVLDGIKSLTDDAGKKLAAMLKQGASVAIFPDKNLNFQAFNPGLRALADLAITGLDTNTQTITTLQAASPLVKDIFHNIPSQVQLPTINWHYKIKAGFSANQQNTMSFRNGDPFLARYDAHGGDLYLCASSAQLDAGNFTGSYFFVPFLNRMAALSLPANSNAITAGRNQAIYLPIKTVGDRDMVHLYANGKDLIPPQRAKGAGMELFTDAAIMQSGFYTIKFPSGDTALIAINPDTRESVLQYHSRKDLEKFGSDNFRYSTLAEFNASPSRTYGQPFPLWKVCVILALVLLAAETFVLLRNIRPRSTLASTTISPS